MIRHVAALLALLLPALPVDGSQNTGPAHDLERVRLTLTPDGNVARYRVREQLARVNFPSDAIGSTSGLSGALVLGDDGRVVATESKITVDVTGLKSDRDRRDGFVQHRTIETDRFPTVELVPIKLNGLPWPLPSSGKFDFELQGNLTVHGATHSTLWKVSAEARDGGFTGTASTSFTFADFGLEKPQVMMVLSVDDTIHLEYDFHLRRE